MATEKKIVKKTATKPAEKKAAVVKPAVKKAPAKKVVAKKEMIVQERFYAMVSEAAYFSSQNDGNKKGAVEYWIEAEAAVRAKFDVAK
jgi:hypothetical protein